MKSEYCSVTYSWKGRGWTQEIRWLRIEGEEVVEWAGKSWTDFLNYMSTKGWELVAAAPLGGGEGAVYGIVAYFKRPG
ncbi:MAG: hypothetical protein F6K58_25915 [Symploca sp. SIO2E9]|nr:hypothetical protein [Symploca sp. SIO2E9]